MFYDNLVAICDKNGVKVTNIIRELGISSGNLSKWKSGAKPRSDTLFAIAKRFNVSTDCLLGIEKPATAEGDGLTDKERELIAIYRQLSADKKKLLIQFVEVAAKE